MAKLEKTIAGDFNSILHRIEDGIQFSGYCLLFPLGKVFVTSNTLVNAISAVVFIIFVLY